MAAGQAKLARETERGGVAACGDETLDDLLGGEVLLQLPLENEGSGRAHGAAAEEGAHEVAARGIDGRRRLDDGVKLLLAQGLRRGDHHHLWHGVKGAQPQRLILWVVEVHVDVLRGGEGTRRRHGAIGRRGARRAALGFGLLRFGVVDAPDEAMPKVHVKDAAYRRKEDGGWRTEARERERERETTETTETDRDADGDRQRDTVREGVSSTNRRVGRRTQGKVQQ